VLKNQRLSADPSSIRILPDISIPFVSTFTDDDMPSAAKKQLGSATNSKKFDKMQSVNSTAGKMVTFTTSNNFRKPRVGKILVVDDERFNCDIIEGFLMILGF
jgi:hypothetical protein